MEKGRIGLCAIRVPTGELISEQLVSVTACAVSAVTELPNDGQVAIVIRNAAMEGSSEVFVKEAILCDRAVNDKALSAADCLSPSAV